MNWTFGIMAVLAIAAGAYAWAMYGAPDGIRQQPLVTGKGSLPSMWCGVLWAHAVSGLGLAIGWLQFVKRLRQRMPNIHHLIGYVYAAMIAIGGITGLYLAFYANGGWVARIGFGALSVMWLYTLCLGIKSIAVDRDPSEHGRWMIRNYALSCAAITLRLYIPLAAVLFGLSDTNDTFPVISWIAWLPNLLFAEMLIHRKAVVRSKSRVR